MRADEVYFKDTERMYHVILSEEFGENFELLCGLITSLYDGLIEFKEDEVKFVYKFAKIYNVDWLRSKAFHLFEGMLSESTFIDIFKFSHSISCEDLKELCADYLTPDFLDTLIKGGELLNIDYHCLRTIISMDYSTGLSEMVKFRLICQWHESEVTKRTCHVQSLLSQITFNVLDKSEVHLVINWVLNNSYMDDACRIGLLKEVNEKANSPILKTTDSIGKKQRLKNCKKIFEGMKSVLTENSDQSCDQGVAFHDFCSVVKDLYPNGDWRFPNKTIHH